MPSARKKRQGVGVDGGLDRAYCDCARRRAQTCRRAIARFGMQPSEREIGHPWQPIEAHTRKHSEAVTRRLEQRPQPGGGTSELELPP